MGVFNVGVLEIYWCSVTSHKWFQKRANSCSQNWTICPGGLAGFIKTSFGDVKEERFEVNQHHSTIIRDCAEPEV